EEELVALEACNEHSWESLAIPLEWIMDTLIVSCSVVNHLQHMKDSKNLRGAIQEIEARRKDFDLKLAQSKPLFDSFKALQEDPNFQNSSDAQKRTVESYMKKVIISGVHLEDGQKKLFNQYEKELVELTRKFSDNILDSIRKYGKLVTSVEEVEGLPATSLALAAKAAASEGYEVASPELGPWLFKIDKSSYFRVMKHLKNRKAREELYLAYRNKASTGEFNNTPVLTRILELRNLKAKLLGYKNYAEVISMLLKMATLDKANELLESLRSGAWDGALRELEALKALAASNGENYELMPWDLPYWMERLREARLDMSEEEFRPFFAFPHVLEGLFLLAKRLFSIEIDAADNLVATSIWHDDVRFFRVKDMDTKETLAYFYIDPYSRPLEKRGGAFVSSFVAKRSRALAPEGCDIRLPACIIVCNQTPPLGDNPSLMTFDELKTLFHEFGHALQHMLTTQEVIFVSGMQNVEQDAVELPSQFMENWCYDKDTLSSFAKHYKTGELLPESLFQKIKSSRTLRAIDMLNQVLLAAVDLKLHSNFEPNGLTTKIHEVYSELSLKTQIPPCMPGEQYLCSFSHISTGNYAAGYYGYKWAEVLSADVFNAFEEAMLKDEKAVKEVGMRFRNTILALGGGMAALDVFKAFRGREPSVDPLLRQYGLRK
ncbi:hypothetical protein SELMODRAFT_85692, partial [Selaginella moellendorffii]